MEPLQHRFEEREHDSKVPWTIGSGGDFHRRIETVLGNANLGNIHDFYKGVIYASFDHGSHITIRRYRHKNLRLLNPYSFPKNFHTKYHLYKGFLVHHDQNKLSIVQLKYSKVIASASNFTEIAVNLPSIAITRLDDQPMISGDLKAINSIFFFQLTSTQLVTQELQRPDNLKVWDVHKDKIVLIDENNRAIFASTLTKFIDCYDLPNFEHSLSFNGSLCYTTKDQAVVIHPETSTRQTLHQIPLSVHKLSQRVFLFKFNDSLQTCDSQEAIPCAPFSSIEVNEKNDILITDITGTSRHLKYV